MSGVLTRVDGQPASGVEAIALRPSRRLPWVVAAAAAASWALLVAAQATGSRLLDHDATFEGGQVGPAGLGLFFIGWQVMVAATMLPVSFPAIRRVAANTSRGAGMAFFLAGFGAVWTAFAWAALSLDSVVHGAVEQHSWLAARPYLVGTGLLVVVGLWQFAPLKGRCLAACRGWAPGPRAGLARSRPFADGARYGQLCLACDGGVMLLMFAVGGGVAWMAILGLVMALERTTRLKGVAHRWIGAALLASAAAALLVGSAL